MSALTGTSSPPRRRGRDSAHSDAELLALVAAVVRAVAADPADRETAPGRVSMSAFNRLRAHVDRARGITDADHPERTPTAEAIHLRFNKDAGRKVSWREIVGGALREDPTMWLAALGREPEQLVPPEVVVYALRRVASALGVSVLGREAYRERRAALIATDRELFGEDGLLEQTLPTVNQIEGQYGFADACQMAGLGGARAMLTVEAAAARRASPPPPQPVGLPAPVAMALYAALNDKWPSRDTLRAFAAASGFTLASVKGLDWEAAMAEAGEMLQAEGVTAPELVRAKPNGRGRRLTFRAPVEMPPGAPRRTERRPRNHQSLSEGLTGTEIERLRRGDPALWAARHELYLIALRVWLDGLSARDRRSRLAYIAWRRGTAWPAPNGFDRDDHGGFTALRDEASRLNAAERRRGRAAVPAELLNRARELQAQLRPADAPPVRSDASARAAEVFEFGTALRAVLAGECREVQR
ncbi:MAG TPA: hypothetical protein VKV27_01560 [Solirubrobacteraceae bacterium]|nr:hypothetical protein [Solirubrobacteraceae bacterium]